VNRPRFYNKRVLSLWYFKAGIVFVSSSISALLVLGKCTFNDDNNPFSGP